MEAMIYYAMITLTMTRVTVVITLLIKIMMTIMITIIAPVTILTPLLPQVGVPAECQHLGRTRHQDSGHRARTGPPPAPETHKTPDFLLLLLPLLTPCLLQASGPGPAQYRREAPSRGEQEAQEAARRQGDSLARQFQEASRRMADPRHAMGMHAMGPGMQHQQALQVLVISKD